MGTMPSRTDHDAGRQSACSSLSPRRDVFRFSSTGAQKCADDRRTKSRAQTVETIHPLRADIAHSFNTNGTLEAFETADLYPKVSGYPR